MPSREIATAAIITADRPRLLARCLESLLSNCELGLSRPRILIVDGSRQDRHRVVNRRAVRSSAARTQLEVDYVGAEQARGLRARLAARGIPRRTLRFGLTPGGTGANRNIAVLTGGGSNLLMIDDDVICAPWSLPARESGVAIAGTAELRDIRFFPTRRAALRMGRPAPISLIDAHRQLLGATSRDLVSGALGDIVTASPDGLWSTIEKGAEYCVRASFAGLAGDSGTACPHHLLFATGALKEKLTRDPVAFATALRSREVIRIARRNIVTRVPNCMAVCMALANDALLPPFLPFGRNQDGLFGVMLHFIDRTALFGHLSYGIVHDSLRASAYASATIVSATQNLFANLLVSFARRARFRSGSASANLAGLSDSLHDVSRLPIREFITRAMQVTLEDRCARLAALRDRLSIDASYPAYWRKAVDRYQDAFYKSAVRPEFYIPVEFKGGRRIDDAFALVREATGQFAELITWWPRMLEVSEIKSR
jgi:hypothetical protein